MSKQSKKDINANEPIPAVELNFESRKKRMLAGYKAKIMLYLAAVFLILIMFFQTSVNSYYELKYQGASPLQIMEKNPIWKSAQNVKNGIDYLITKISDTSDEFGKELSEKINKILHLKNKEQIEQELALEEQKKQEEARRKEFELLRQEEERLREEAKKKAELEEAEPFMEKVAGDRDFRKVKFPPANYPVVLEEGDQVLIVGDSLQQGVAPHIRAALTKKYKIKSINLSKTSTGFVNTDFFNWNQTIRDNFKNNPKIKLMIVLVGANDKNSMKLFLEADNYKKARYINFNTELWIKAYEQRVLSAIYTARSHGAQIIWVGLPNMRNKVLNNAVQIISKIQKKSTNRAGILYIESNPLLGMTDDGVFLNYITKEDGTTQTVRLKDGVHLDATGQRIVANKVLSYITYKKKETEIQKENEKQKEENRPPKQVKKPAHKDNKSNK